MGKSCLEGVSCSSTSATLGEPPLILNFEFIHRANTSLHMHSHSFISSSIPVNKLWTQRCPTRFASKQSCVLALPWFLKERATTFLKIAKMLWYVWVTAHTSLHSLIHSFMHSFFPRNVLLPFQKWFLKNLAASISCKRGRYFSSSYHDFIH